VPVPPAARRVHRAGVRGFYSKEPAASSGGSGSAAPAKSHSARLHQEFQQTAHDREQHSREYDQNRWHQQQPPNDEERNPCLPGTLTKASRGLQPARMYHVLCAVRPGFVVAPKAPGPLPAAYRQTATRKRRSRL